MKKRLVGKRQQRICGNHRGVCRVEDPHLKQLRPLTVDRDPKPMKMTRIANVEAGGTLAAAIGFDVADEIELIALECQIMVEHGRGTLGESRIGSRSPPSLAGAATSREYDPRSNGLCHQPFADVPAIATRPAIPKRGSDEDAMLKGARYVGRGLADTY